MLQPLVWATYRLLFLALYATVVLTGGLPLFLLGPLTSHLLFGDTRFWRYFRYYMPLTGTVYRQLAMLVTDRRYAALFRVPILAPPALSPDPAQVALAPAWRASHRDCAGCSCCCGKLGCGLLQAETGRCLAYGSFYWRYFNCGRYPSSQAQIDYFACPKWIMAEAHAERA